VAAVVSGLVDDPGALLDMVVNLARPAGALAMPFVPRLR
jgi:hypothetical protein